MIDLSSEQKKMLKNMGALGYPPVKISSIMGFDLKEIESDLADVKSEFFKIYQEGNDMANYLIDLKLFEMAQSGDIKAIEKLEQRKKNMELNFKSSSKFKYA